MYEISGKSMDIDESGTPHVIIGSIIEKENDELAIADHQKSPAGAGGRRAPPPGSGRPSGSGGPAPFYGGSNRTPAYPPAPRR